MPPRKRLGQLLTELHVVDEHQLHSALGHQKQWGGKLGAILVQKGFCREEQVVSALSTHLGMPVVRLSTQKVDPRAVKLVTRPIAEKLHVFAYEVTGSGRGEVVTIAMSDPTDLSAVDQLAFHTGKRIKPMLCGDSEIVNAIVTNYGDNQPAAAAKPAAATPAVAPPAPSATTAFPRRIEPNPAAAPPPRAPSPYIPPPIPARTARPVEVLEEIEPVDADSFANFATAQPAARQEPLELSESDGAADGPMEGLEPIAAHVQEGEEVNGQEELAGDGTAADALEGLEAASEGTRHEGVESAPLEGLERSDAQPPEASWDAAPQADSPEWGAAPEGGWDAAPAAGAEPGSEADLAVAAPHAEAGWGDAAQPEAPVEAQDWGAGTEAPDVTWETEQSEWGAAEPAQVETGEAAAAEEPVNEELPADAIIGTADALEGDAGSWAEAALAEDSGVATEEPAAPEAGEAEPPPAQEEPAEAADPDAFEEHGAAPPAAPEVPAVGLHEAEAPDAWATSEDPLAAGQETAVEPAWDAPAQQEPQAEPEQAWAAPADAWAAQEVDAWGEAAAEAAPAVDAAAAGGDQPAEAGWPPEVAADQGPIEPVAQQPESAESPFGEHGSEEHPPSDAQADLAPAEEPQAAGEASPEAVRAAARAFAEGAFDHDERTAEEQAPASEPPAFAEHADALHGDEGASPSEPAHPEGLAPEPDSDGLAAQEPPADLAAEQPHAEFAAEEPHAELVVEEPHRDLAAEQPRADLAAEEPQAEDPHPDPAAAADPEGQAFAEVEDAASGHATQEEIAAGAEAHEPAAEVSAAEAAPGESAADEEIAVFEDEPSGEQPGADQGTAESGLEGWVAPPPEPPAVGAGWLGEALAATVPLSPADFQTLSAVGVDVNDGVGALRLLAAMLRVLQRHDVINFDELAGELAQSRAGHNGGDGSDQPPSEGAL